MSGIDRMQTLMRWQKCDFKTKSQADMHEHMAVRALSYKVSHYDPVTKATNIPWYLIAAYDMREENFNHSGYLGNGDPLWKKTTHVPKGRGPFASWFEGAIDALKLDNVSPKFGHGNHWDLVTALIASEKYNGLGYATKGLPSPYVWAGTNIQVKGKYVADGHFDPNAMDTQPGCAGLFLALKKNHGIDLNEA